MNLGRLEGPRNCSSNHKRPAEDSASRSVNLEWRLGFASSRLGLGMVHKESGEWGICLRRAEASGNGSDAVVGGTARLDAALYALPRRRFSLVMFSDSNTGRIACRRKENCCWHKRNLYFRSAELFVQGIECARGSGLRPGIAALSIQRQGFVSRTQGRRST